MPKFRKVAVSPGLYTTPDGVSEVTSTRIRHWHRTLQGMFARGYRPPLSWGHVASAEPHTADDAVFWRSRFNAGTITGSEIDDEGNLVLLGDAPGVQMDNKGNLVSDVTLPDGRKVKTSISEVSIGARDWTDGQGKTWPDAPIHLALAPLPVWAPQGGQPGFQAASDSRLQRFGTETLLRRHAPKRRVTMDVEIDDLLKALKDFGIHLPPGTTEETFNGNLHCALLALAGKRKGEVGHQVGEVAESMFSTITPEQAEQDRLAAVVDEVARNCKLPGRTQFATAAAANRFTAIADEVARNCGLPARRK